MINRKKFIRLGAWGVSSLFVTATLSNSIVATNRSNKKTKVRFGIISDLHYDLMHDGEQRAQQFITTMKNELPDFIIQLGDFCVPKPENKKLLEIWNQFRGDAFHVLGNHDTDGGYSAEQTLTFWQMPARYYSFDKNGFHFVVLDGNEKSETNKISGYPRTIASEQRQWLKTDLQKTNLPCVIFCHQGLDNTDNGLDNGMEIRYLLEQINRNAGFKKVLLVCSGHHHLNYHNEINGIHYVQINSASYYWAGEDYTGSGLPDSVYRTHPILKHTLIYKDPIWAVITIDMEKNIEIDGSESSLAGPDLAHSGIDQQKSVYPITAKIDSRKLRY
ncbi:metallophosphoesterase family protein [Sphingobacterium suaedae]|uniref:Metallophosphoesterase family protein n=1 Tax=Sphingobacterium suaedae TaxID=1686402 RepID=A0ABW5KHJ0_9SPHI